MEIIKRSWRKQIFFCLFAQIVSILLAGSVRVVAKEHQLEMVLNMSDQLARRTIHRHSQSSYLISDIMLHCHIMVSTTRNGVLQETFSVEKFNDQVIGVLVGKQGVFGKSGIEDPDWASGASHHLLRVDDCAAKSLDAGFRPVNASCDDQFWR